MQKNIPADLSTLSINPPLPNTHPCPLLWPHGSQEHRCVGSKEPSGAEIAEDDCCWRTEQNMRG